MASWLEKLTNAHILALKPYESARRLFSSSKSAAEGQAKQVWLNANEAPNEATLDNRYRLDDSFLNRYPDCQPDDLIQAYAQYADLAPSQVVCTRGADEGIELIIRAFCQAGKSKVLICPPTYGMYAISAETFNVGVERAPLRNDFSLDLEAVASFVDKVNVVFLCSPNNPTGTRLSQDDIEKVLSLFEGKAIVVLDEAYIEFDLAAKQTALLSKYPHLVILRTLSKAFALAGIRCGFTLSSPQIQQMLMKVIAPYPVPAPVSQIASQALSSAGLSVMQARVERTQSASYAMLEQLKQIDAIHIVGSQKANFILFKTQKAPELMAHLVKNGMIIRDQSKQLNLDKCLRITLGTEDENRMLISLIQQFFKGSNKPDINNSNTEALETASTRNML